MSNRSKNVAEVFSCSNKSSTLEYCGIPSGKDFKNISNTSI
jgi:hypothetical protein